jgi:AraC-like DNA-binding protein
MNREMLQRFPAIRTSDPAEMKDALFTAYGANSFDFRTSERFEAQVKFVQFDDVGVGFCGYSAPTTVAFSEGEFVRLQIAIKGRAETTLGGRHFEIGGPIGCITPSGQPLSASFGKNYEQLLVRIKASALERKLSSILGAKPKGRLEFSPVADLSRAHGQSLYQMILIFAEQLNSTRMLPPLVLQHLQRAMTSAFLYATRHSFSDQLDDDAVANATPQFLRRAEEYIEVHWNEGVTIEKLTKITGHSARGIFSAFRQYRGYSPMAFEKTVRLKHANELLKVAHPRTTVTGVAYACGFSNLGHFAKDYRAMFKEQPSETIRHWK